MQYHSFTRISACVALLFHPFKAIFLSPSTMAFFTVITVGDCLFHQTYQFPHHPRVWPLVQIAVTIKSSIPSLRIFTIWRVAGWQQPMRRPPLLRIQNGPPFIIDRLSPGGGSRGGVFHEFSNIYTPPPKPPQIRECQIDTSPHGRNRGVGARAHARVIPNLRVGVGVLSLERVRCDTGTVITHGKRQSILYAEHPQRAPPP